MTDYDKLLHYKQIAERFLGLDIPWRAATGPQGWQKAGLGHLPLYALEIDTMKLPASQLARKIPNFIHDTETASGGRVRVGYTNSIGLAVWFDERGYPEIDVVNELAACQFSMLMGGPGAGKTMLLNRLIEAKRAAETVVLYPKKMRGNKISPLAKVIGAEGDYPAIEAELERWFKLAHRVDESDPPRYLVCDDWTVTLDVRPDLAELPFKIAKLGREGNLHVTLVVHLNTAGGLLLPSGKGELLRPFVTADLRRVRDSYFGFLDYGDGQKRQFVHPGIWQSTVTAADKFGAATTEDWLLARLALRFNNGRAGVVQLRELAKAHLAPKLTARGGPFTDWQIQKRLEKWDAAGWLTGRDTVTEQRELAADFATWAKNYRGTDSRR